MLKTTKVNGFTRELDMSEAIQRLMAGRAYEPEQTKWIKEHLRPGQRFVDVGANFGYYASLASSIVGPHGRVFAFEPSPVAQASLQKMVAQNKIDNIELVQAAVGSSAGEIHLYLPRSGPVHSPSIFPLDDNFTPHLVKMIALSDYAPLNDGRAIDLIKIDVEGYEPNVLEGMRSLIERKLVRKLLCEFNSGWLRRNNDMTPAKLLDIILGYGFTITAKTKKTVGMEYGGQVSYELQDILFSMP